MISLLKILFPINRSLTGVGNIKSLKIIKNVCKNLKIKFFKSGKKVYDWRIPEEWNVKNAFIINPSGEKICNFKKNNLHLVGYSLPIKKKITLSLLKKKLHTLKNYPTAIPYVTSYYKKYWGFCIKYNEFKKLKKGMYEVFIDSKFKKGKMHYGEILIKGKSKKEIFLSSYICHPSMANNELSGPVVLAYVSKWLDNLSKKNKLNYSYRILFIPETIGSIAYLNKNLNYLKKYIIAGYNISCVGDNEIYSYIPSKYGNSISDKVYQSVLKKNKKKFKIYHWNERGSDERQYCAPFVDLPIGTITRSKFGKYKEYHTSEDNYEKVVSQKGLLGSLKYLKQTLQILEKKQFPSTTVLCEPFLTKYNLYPTLSFFKKKITNSQDILNILTWCDGKNDLLEISKKSKININIIKKNLKILIKQKLVKIY